MSKYNIEVRNVNEALVEGLNLIKQEGVPHKSRAGEVLEIPHPVITTYKKPRERMLFSPERDANPFFHIFEALWMLAGKDDIKWLTKFNKRMSEYSDDGKTLNGAYGKRWCSWFGYNQLEAVINTLKKDKGTRRAVMGIWDATKDLTNTKSKDLPCNISVIFSLRHGKLNMGVNNRSNDMIWGAYGANVVHFSMLQEYIANMIGAEVGEYHQISYNLHVYVDNPVYQKCLEMSEVPLNRYISYESLITSTHDYTYQKKLVENPATFHSELNGFIEDVDTGNDTPQLLQSFNSYFRDIAYPMWRSYKLFKQKHYEKAIQTCEEILALDVRVNCQEWLDRRYNNFLNKKNV